MSYWIHPEAETELGDAAVYYAKHAGLAISEAFLLEFERVLEILVENQGRGPYGEFGFRVYHFGRGSICKAVQLNVLFRFRLIRRALKPLWIKLAIRR